MFLERNVAGQNFTIPGALRLVADGSAVIAGASITIVKDGVDTAGGGTLTHVAGGAWKYTPTQGETDCKIMGFVLTATGAVTVSGSARTTHANPDDGHHLGLTVLPSSGTILVKPAVTLDAADVTGNLPVDLQTIKSRGVGAPPAGVEFPAYVGTSTLTQAQVTGGTYSLNTDSGGNVTLATSQPDYAPAKAGDAMALTTGERSAVAAAVMTDVSHTVGADVVATNTAVAAIKVKTDNLPPQPAAVGSPMTLSTQERQGVADAVLTRDWVAVAGEAAHSMLNALRATRNRWVVSPEDNTLTVYKEDGTTIAWSVSLTSAVGALPITGGGG